MMGATGRADRRSRAKGDKRFKHEDWEEHFVFDYVKQSYLHRRALAARARSPSVEGSTTRPRRRSTSTRASTSTRWRRPISRSPIREVFRETVTTGGQNLVKGLHNLLDDIERGNGQLKISMTDTKAFELGDNIATTPGKVVFQNELMQLLQYEPTTTKVHKRPLLIVPPWINKFYILDLREKNSFIKWAVDQGYTVFVISWVNPDERLAHKDFDDYMQRGAAGGARRDREGDRRARGHGASATASAARCWPRRSPTWRRRRTSAIASATFFTALVDFTEPGELEVFIDEEQLAVAREEDEQARLSSKAPRWPTTFNMLRANDLIWSFVVNNYLLGTRPVPVRPAATGTPTRRACRRRCTATTCATCT